MSDRYFRDINSLAQWLQWLALGDKTIALVMDPNRDQAKRKQYHLAKRLRDGDLLLSFIKGVCCWSGVWLVKTNTAKGHTQPLNEVGSNDPWSHHFGRALDVEPIIQLITPEQCFFTTNARLALKYQGRGIYTQMGRLDDCERIIAAIRGVAGETAESIRKRASPQQIRDLDDFGEQWDGQLERDPYLTNIAVARSGDRCDVCGTTAKEWVARLQKSRPDEAYRDVFSDPHYDYAFLEGHHRLPRARGGDSSLQNLLALCPNCHRVIGRNLDALARDRGRAQRTAGHKGVED